MSRGGSWRYSGDPWSTFHDNKTIGRAGFWPAIGVFPNLRANLGSSKRSTLSVDAGNITSYYSISSHYIQYHIFLHPESTVIAD